MIIMQFTVWDKKKELFSSFERLLPLQEMILGELVKKFPFLALAEYVGVDNKPDSLAFSIIYHGLAAGSDENTAYINHNLSVMLNDLGLSDFLHHGIMARQIFGDREPIDNVIPGKKPFNSTLLEKYNVPQDKIPGKFICCISHQIMDTPVYILGKNDRYDFNSLIAWYIRNGKRRDPATNQYVDVSDIIHDGPLKAEINKFIGNILAETLALESQNKQQASTVSPGSINKQQDEKDLRQAAADGQISALEALIKKGTAVNAQDSNLARKRTALHWAVIKNRVDCVKVLLNAGARIDIEDAEGKTASKLVEASLNEEMIKLFGVKKDIDSLYQALKEVDHSLSPKRS